MRGDHVFLLREILWLGRPILFAPGLAHHVDRCDVLQLDRVRAIGRELDSEVVDLFRNAGSVGVDAKLRGLRARPLESEDDVVSGERRTVMPLHSGAQLEAPGDRIDLLPRYRELRHEIELLVAADQEFVHEVVDVVGQAFVLRMRIGRLRIAAVGPAQRLGV